MDVLWQSVVSYSTRPLEVSLINKEVFTSVSVFDLANAVACHIILRDYPRLKKARQDWAQVRLLGGREEDDHASRDCMERKNSPRYHPSVLVAYVNGYLPWTPPHPSVIRCLLRFGTKHVDAALHAAAARDNPEICDVLIELGANVHNHEDSALRLAARQNCHSVVRFLLSRGADANVRRSEPLVTAVTHGHIEVVKALLGGGADVDCRWGKPLRTACTQRRTEIIRLLLDAGASIRKQRALARTFNSKDTGPLEVFLDHENFDPSRNARTAMNYAVQYGSLAHAELILSRHGGAFKEEDYVQWHLLIGLELMAPN
jgi:ankyrin repeat protein